MTKQQALQFIAAALQDFLATLPPSARAPFQAQAQAAINEIEKPAAPADTDHA